MGQARWLRLDLTWSASEWLVSLTPAARLAWVELLCYTKAYGMKGTVKALGVGAASRLWGIGPDDITSMLEAAKRDDALACDEDDWRVENWAQYQEIDPTAGDRQRRYRAENTTPKLIHRNAPLPAVTDRNAPINGVTRRATGTGTGTGTVVQQEAAPPALQPPAVSNNERRRAWLTDRAAAWKDLCPEDGKPIPFFAKLLSMYGPVPIEEVINHLGAVGWNPDAEHNGDDKVKAYRSYLSKSIQGQVAKLSKEVSAEAEYRANSDRINAVLRAKWAAQDAKKGLT